MLSPDAFRARFDQTIASLRAWTGFVADVARIEVADDGVAWRLAIVPKAHGACPIEMMLRRDQMMDLALGPETFEDLSLQDLELPLRLVEAVAEGRVITRTRRTQGTGMLHSVETLVTLSDGSIWRSERTVAAPRLIERDETIVTDHHYTPYRR